MSAAEFVKLCFKSRPYIGQSSARAAAGALSSRASPNRVSMRRFERSIASPPAKATADVGGVRNRCQLQKTREGVPVALTVRSGRQDVFSLTVVRWPSYGAPGGSMMPIARGRALIAALGLAALLLPHVVARAFDVVLSTQGEYMDAYLVNGTAFPPKYVFDDPDPANPASITGTAPRGGRHLNGKLCFFPPGLGRNHQFVVAD